MSVADVNKDRQATRMLNDVQLNTSRYTKAANDYNQPDLTYHGKPVGQDNPVSSTSFLRSLAGVPKQITTSDDLRANDNTNFHTLLNDAGWAKINASISAGGHIEVPVLTAFGEALSRGLKSKAFDELSDQGKEIYRGYVRTMAAVPAYQKALTGIGRSNKEMLDLELANIANPTMSPEAILDAQSKFQENIDRASEGFPQNLPGLKNIKQTRSEVENPKPKEPQQQQQLPPINFQIPTLLKSYGGQ
jgi:hypothetical protein